MVKIYCDRCGKLANRDPGDQKGITYEINILVKEQNDRGKNWTSVDLCDICRYKLENIVEDFINNANK